MTELERIFFFVKTSDFFLTSVPSTQLAVISDKEKSEVIFKERKWYKINGWK